MRRMSLAVLAVCVAAFCVGCPQQMGSRIEVVVLQYPDRAPLPFGPAEYERHFFDETTTYRTTPGGHAIFGSVAEWFSWVSGGRLQLTGYVRPVVLTAARGFDEVMRLENLAARGEDGGAWWVDSINRDALAALGRSVPTDGSSGAVDADRLIIIHNGTGAPRMAWAVGYISVMSGATPGNTDVMSLGLPAHELSHLLTNQPDRYFFSNGNVGGWDVMATDSFDNFPTAYTVPGMVDAGWVSWGDWKSSGDVDLVLEPTLDTAVVHRFASRLDDVGVAAHSFFALENKVARDETETQLQGPVEGLLTWEYDTQRLWAVSGAYGGVPAEYAKIIGHREVTGYASQSEYVYEDYARWALWGTPTAAAMGLPTINGCVNSRALNVLGECIWDFTDVHREGVNMHVHAAFHPLTLSRRLVNADTSTVELPEVLPGSNPVRRLYFAGPQTLSLVLLSPDGARQVIHSAAGPATLSQHVVDLTAYPQGGTLFFESPGQGSSPLAAARGLAYPVSVVSRSGANPIAPAMPAQTVALRNGSHWGGIVASVAPGGLLEFPVPRPASWTDGSSSFWAGSAAMRLVLAWGMNGTSAMSASEQVTVQFALTGARGRKESVFYGKVDARRSEPFVVYFLVDALSDLPGLASSIMVSRGSMATQDMLHVLAADLVDVADDGRGTFGVGAQPPQQPRSEPQGLDDPTGLVIPSRHTH